MIKVVIIGWIIFCVVTFILKCIMSSLSDAEQIALLINQVKDLIKKTMVAEE